MSALANIARAREVLSLGEKLEHQASAASAEHQGTHWTFYVLAAGAIVGVVIAVAAAVFGAYPLVATGVLLSCTNALGAYYIKELGELKELSIYINQLTEKVAEFWEQIDVLKKQNMELKDSEETLKKETAEEKEVFQKGKKDLETVLKQYDRVTSDLKVTEAKFEELRDLYVKLKAASAEFSNEVYTLTQETNTLDKIESDLKGDVVHIEFANKHMDDTLNLFKEENHGFTAENKKLDAHIKNLREIIPQIKKRTDQLQAKNKELQQQIDQLTADAKTMGSNLDQIDSEQAKSTAIEQKLAKHIDTLRNLEGLEKLIPLVKALNKDEKVALAQKIQANQISSQGQK